ncbi:MAG TPA: hypothetical protein VMY88_06505 [Acidimicrobiales bacterium]|nr:hypothetical protein [Acidimicrobiales bacterium]
MKGTVVARVRRVLMGHSERALVHAVDDATNFEHKIEVASDALRDLVPGQEYALMLSWTLEPLVSDTTSRETAAPPARAPTPLPSAVDEEFMALMARPRGRAVAGPTSAARPNPPPPLDSGAPVVTSAAEQLAERLGIRPGRATS